MSYNFFQNALDAGKVTQPAQPAYVPSVIKDQSVYNSQVKPQSSITEEEKQYLKSQGFSDAEIIQAGQQQVPAQEQQQAPAQDKGYLDTAIQGVKDFSAGVSAAGTQAAGGALSIASDIVAAPFSDTVSYGGIFRGDNTGGPGQFFRDETKRQLAQGAESFGANTNNLTYNVGKTGAGIGLAAVTPGGVLGAAGKEAGLLTKVGLNATQGAIETAKFNALTDGRIGTPTELATGAAIGGALPVAGAALSKAKDFVTTKLPESLIATGIATPSKLLNASERLNKLGDPSFQDATSVSKWLLGNKIAGDLEQRTTQLADLAKTSREFAQTILKGNTTTVADDIALQAKKGLETLRTKLEGAGLDKYVAYIDDALAKGTWTAEDLNKARTFMADKGGIFKHSGDWVDSLQKENLQDIWKASSKYLDETIPGFRAANKDYEVASALGEAIKLKQAQDIGRQVFSLVNVTGAGLGGTIGGLTTGGDPMSILKGAALGVGGRYIFSPANMSKLALKLSEYAPKSEAGKIAKAIEAFIVSRGSKDIPTKYVDIIKSAAKTSKGVITPKPTSIINLPKKPLISRVQEVAKKLDMSKNTKGFINPSAMVEDLGLKAKDSTKALMDEARKYSSAEEFVSSIKGERLLTGQRSNWKPRPLREYNPETDDSLFYGPGLYLTPTKEIAAQYANNGGVIHTVIADIKNPLKPSMKDWQVFIGKGNGKMKLDFLKRKGYDAVVDVKGKYKQVMIVDPTSVKTESQLKDIYNMSKN